MILPNPPLILILSSFDLTYTLVFEGLIYPLSTYNVHPYQNNC